MRAQRGKGGVVPILIAPIEYCTGKADKIPAAQFQIGHQRGGGPIGWYYQQERPFVAHEGLVQRAGKVWSRHQCNGVNAQIGSNGGIVG